MERISRAFGAMRFAYGAVLVLAGLDKIFATNLIVYWPQYISPAVHSILASVGLPTTIFLVLMGVVELVVGVLFFTRWTYVAAYLSVAWLIAIAVNLVLLGVFDIAIRDLLLAVGAYAIAELALLREP